MLCTSRMHHTDYGVCSTQNYVNRQGPYDGPFYDYLHYFLDSVSH